MNLTDLEDIGIDILHQAFLSDFTTFRLGGKCPFLITCQTPQQLEQVVQLFNQEHENFILIGDLKSEATEALPPLSPRVNIAAAKQADAVLEYIIKNPKLNKLNPSTCLFSQSGLID